MPPDKIIRPFAIGIGVAASAAQRVCACVAFGVVLGADGARRTHA